MKVTSILPTDIPGKFILTVANVNTEQENEQALRELNDKFTVRLVPVESIKPKSDPYFRLQGGKEVYIYEGYNREAKKYQGYAFNDVNKFKYLKKGTMVEVGFEF